MKQRGESLVEVLVGITVFLCVAVALLSSFGGMQARVLRQEELLRFEMLCRDIDAYYDVYGADWDILLFEGKAENGTVFFDAEFQLSAEPSTYRLEYGLEDGALVVNVPHQETGRVIIEALNYGEANVGG